MGAGQSQIKDFYRIALSTFSKDDFGGHEVTQMWGAEYCYACVLGSVGFHVKVTLSVALLEGRDFVFDSCVHNTYYQFVHNTYYTAVSVSRYYVK